MRATTRDQSIDVAKGLAIILIVLGHVLRGLSAAGMTAGHSDGFHRADTMIYLLHLPAFALLSGLFVQRSVEARGGREYLWRRAVDFTWVYVWWTTIQGLVKIVTSSLVNAPLTLGELGREFIKPTSQMWYLPFLLLITIAAVAGTPWRPCRRPAAAALAGFISLASWGHFGSYAGLMGWGLCGFFMAGVLIGAGRFTALLRHRRFTIASCGLAAVYLAIVFSVSPVPPTVPGLTMSPATVTAGVAASVAGLGALLGMARGLATMRHTEWLANIGRRSMEIFLAHIIFASGTRIVLAKVGVNSLPIHIVAGLTAGVAGSLALAYLARRLNWSWLYSAPAGI